MSLRANAAIRSDKEMLDADQMTEVNVVIANKTLRRLMRGSQHLLIIGYLHAPHSWYVRTKVGNPTRYSVT